MRNGSRSIKEIVQFDDEELTEEKIEAEDQGDAQADRQGREALPAGDEAGGQAGQNSAVEKASLPSRALYAGSDARGDVESLPRAGFQPAGKEAPD